MSEAANVEVEEKISVLNGGAEGVLESPKANLSGNKRSSPEADDLYGGEKEEDSPCKQMKKSVESPEGSSPSSRQPETDEVDHTLGKKPDGCQGKKLLNCKICLYWPNAYGPGKGSWFEATVRDFDESDGTHQIQYNDGEDGWYKLQDWHYYIAE